jgi:wyosine [tRNA(Phe)-imidazoG37] synthetase (radical SAM superfamily)
MQQAMIVFGPVPSRRLGQSLGINNIIPKSCSYDCLYCQVGRTTDRNLTRRFFYSPENILEAVREKVHKTRKGGGRIDYLSFVPDGEPTLDIYLGESIRLLKQLRIPIAVFTNSSLLYRPDVRADLALADWVSVKVDAVEPRAWQMVNRPNKKLNLELLLQGIRDFAAEFRGELATETMLVAGINDGEENLQATARFIAGLKPDVAYLAIPTRPPTVEWVKAPDEGTMQKAYQIFSGHIENVEYLIGYSGEPFPVNADPAEAILSITAVHPMREEEALDYLRNAGADRSVLDELLACGDLAAVEHEGRIFYLRKFGKVEEGMKENGN